MEQLSNIYRRHRRQWLSDYYIFNNNSQKNNPTGFSNFQRNKKQQPSSSSSSSSSSSEHSNNNPQESSNNSSSSSSSSSKKSEKSDTTSKKSEHGGEKKEKSSGSKEKETTTTTTTTTNKSKSSTGTSSGSGSGSGSGNGSSGPRQPNPRNNFWLNVLLLLPLCWLLFGPNWTYTINQNQITFQQFKSHMLEPGIVDHIEVINKEVARVYLKPEGATTTSTIVEDVYDDRDVNLSSARKAAKKLSSGQYDRNQVYEFHIGTVPSFEEKLMIAQEDMDLPPTEWVPVSYVDEVNIKNRLFSFLTSSPFLTLLVFWWILRIFRKNAESLSSSSSTRGPMGKGPGGFGSLFDVTRANYKVVNKGEKVKTKFSDVAGLDQAKEEVVEFVKFLKNPEQYTKLGAHIPKGALLVGPPGTGKTLLARAVAGEAECPFFSISGSDFVEMFIGVGPSRVRNLFEEARKNAPCIIFIDEIDAVGRKRAKGGWSGGNDERENTLNQLLVEMDGFKTDTNVVVLAGTNRADILDSALTRPGRFDRQIQIEKPDIKGRIEIFKVHCRKIKLEQPIHDVAQRMATLTPGFTGADIANVVNEAALRAARKNKDSVGMVDFYEANDRVIGGLEKRKVMTPHEKSLIAHHEAGHVVAGWFLEHAEPLLKVTIIPRASGALGFAQFLPKELQLYTATQLYHRICMALGGRAAEQIFFGRISTGGVDDLDKVTKLAYGQISIYGMNDKLGNLSFPPQQSEGIQTYRPYSEKTAEIIDEEASKLVRKAYTETLILLTEKKELVAKLAQKLLELETLSHEELVQILGERPFQTDAYKEYITNTKDFAVKYGSDEQMQIKEKEEQEKKEKEIENKKEKEEEKKEKSTKDESKKEENNSSNKN